MTELQSLNKKITCLLTRRITFSSHFFPQCQFKVSVLIVFVTLFPQSGLKCTALIKTLQSNVFALTVTKHALQPQKLDLMRNRITRRLASENKYQPMNTLGQARFGSACSVNEGISLGR
jgi:hypothetical protein